MAKKEASFKLIMLMLIFSLLVAALWDSLPWLKGAIHAVLDPTAGFLLTWNLTAGMFVIVLVITFLTTLIQKYTTDQATLKEMKKEQKIMQQQMKEFRSHPEKLAELQKKQLESIPKTMKLSMRAFTFTAVPLILFFRWFNDVFTAKSGYTIVANPVFLGFMGWFIFYLLASIVFSGILRKWMNVV
jgi:uncharacterized membrane protein (DUF106 family)